MSDNLQAIVRGLSEGQREALLVMDEHPCNVAEWQNMYDRKLVVSKGWRVKLTPLGMQVRALLQDTGHE